MRMGERVKDAIYIAALFIFNNNLLRTDDLSDRYCFYVIFIVTIYLGVLLRANLSETV